MPGSSCSMVLAAEQPQLQGLRLVVAGRTRASADVRSNVGGLYFGRAAGGLEGADSYSALWLG